MSKKMSFQQALELCRKINKKGKLRAIPAGVAVSRVEDTARKYSANTTTTIIIKNEKHASDEANFLVVEDEKFFKKLWREFYSRANKGEYEKLLILKNRQNDKGPKLEKLDWRFIFEKDKQVFSTKEAKLLQKATV